MILDYQKELQEYKAKRKSYNTAVQAIQQKKVATDKAPLLANIKTIDDTDNTNNLMDPTEPEQLAALYEKISEETSTVYAADLPENCSVCGYANQRAFNNKKRELLESAEQLKTAILQAMLLNLLRDLQLNDDIIRLQTSPSLGCRAITHCLAWFNIIYGLFKGYSAVAAALVLAINISNPITIACSGVSALLFGAMSYLFEGREIYKAGHATGNTGSVNKQIGQQYGLAVEMSNLIIQETQRTPEQPPSAQAAAIIPMEPRSPKMERYHQALDRITHCDLSNTAQMSATVTCIAAQQWPWAQS